MAISGKIEGKYKAASKDTLEDDRYPGAEEIENLWKKMNAIEEKNRCVRVRFLDWLSVKLLAWSNAVQDMSNRIDSPCAIKLPAKASKKK